ETLEDIDKNGDGFVDQDEYIDKETSGSVTELSQKPGFIFWLLNSVLSTPSHGLHHE
ncbi:RCN1 isoform 5, partial [Pan troglodytes]